MSTDEREVKVMSCSVPFIETVEPEVAGVKTNHGPPDRSGGIEEMIGCKDSYPEDPRAYFLVAILSLGTIQDREENFINRHGLYGQFQHEDKQGKR